MRCDGFLLNGKGDVLPVEVSKSKSTTKLRIGAGLIQEADAGFVKATRCGVFRQVSAGSNVSKLFVDNVQKRYVPAAEDFVIGTVLEKHADVYRLDIGASQLARLPSLAFEGATKKNRPNIAVGALVYARVESANKDMEPDLTCTSPHFKKEWVTGQSVFGELVGGYAFECTLSLARQLLDEKCFVLRCLGRHFPFELAIGMNGRVWINSTSPTHTILISNAILNSEAMTNGAIQTMVYALIKSISE